MWQPMLTSSCRPRLLDYDVVPQPSTPNLLLLISSLSTPVLLVAESSCCSTLPLTTSRPLQQDRIDLSLLLLLHQCCSIVGVGPPAMPRSGRAAEWSAEQCRMNDLTQASANAVPGSLRMPLTTL
jgi:hypothetical protein